MIACLDLLLSSFKEQTPQNVSGRSKCCKGDMSGHVRMHESCQKCQDGEKQRQMSHPNRPQAHQPCVLCRNKMITWKWKERTGRALGPVRMRHLPLFFAILADRKSTRLNSSHTVISY